LCFVFLCRQESPPLPSFDSFEWDHRAPPLPTNTTANTATNITTVITLSHRHYYEHPHRQQNCF
jgi:hypothetical protein